jgi:hypothetical protein
MKRFAVLGLVVFVAFSCKESDPQFCECMKAGEELNAFSAELLNGDITAEKDRKLQDLKQRKKQACKNYQTMNGSEMLEKKAGCER